MISTVVERTEQKKCSYQQRVHQSRCCRPKKRAPWRRWHDNQDVAAAHRLVTSHMRLVTKLARGFSGYGLPAEELVSEGNVGLMQALKRFDPERGFCFATYALMVETCCDARACAAQLVAGENGTHGCRSGSSSTCAA